jgi:hypothetical protein
MAALPEAFGYPAQAKLLHQRLGTFRSLLCCVIDFDVRERFWALDAVRAASAARISSLAPPRGTAPPGLGKPGEYLLSTPKAHR